MLRQLFIAGLVGLALSAPNDKIDDRLHLVLKTRKVANIVVSFDETDTVVRRVDNLRFANRGEKITFLKKNLEEHTDRTQTRAIQYLDARSISFTSLWINNRIYIKEADAELVEHLASLKNVQNIREEFIAYLDKPIPSNTKSIDTEWGLEKMEVPAAWALPGGNNGEGIVVGNIDTGVRYTHEALRNNFRGSRYGWFDTFTRTGNPTDTVGHGTHHMGTIVGSNGIGVAPGAQWIACRACNYYDECPESSLSTCGQFIACPTLPNGQSADCTKAPNIVSNSWSGTVVDTWYDSVINVWRSAGIVPVFSQGDNGRSCGTVNSPSDNINVISVGSTTEEDEISYYSSRGPALGGLIKPDISAPGEHVRSAWISSDTAYETRSGTSMSCPHAAGVAALLLAQNPNLTFDQVKDLLQDNTDRDLGSAETCGGIPPTEFPNNIYGYGRINARKSLTAAISGH